MPSHKILFVEDEAALALIVKDSLESEGYQVNQVGDGPAAIKAFYEDKPDLVILDVMLPRLNGIEVAKTIRDTDRETPIIFLTAKSQVKDVIKGFEAGGNDYLRKPFSVEELIIRMKVMLSQNRILDHLAEDEQSTFQLGNYHFDSHQQIL
ncbi:MAG: response regulator, partial [Bacteroidota bacterium]